MADNVLLVVNGVVDKFWEEQKWINLRPRWWSSGKHRRAFYFDDFESADIDFKRSGLAHKMHNLKLFLVEKTHLLQ